MVRLYGKKQNILLTELLLQDLTPIPYRENWGSVHSKFTQSHFTTDEHLGYFLGLMAADGSYLDRITFVTFEKELMQFVEQYTGGKSGDGLMVPLTFLKPEFQKIRNSRANCHHNNRSRMYIECTV